tara:strand:- start:136 stop:1383 length:1248 start_codon:yes stop_codon:yes gene_type:complete
MAEIAGQQGAALTNELAQYLQNADGEVSSEELAGIINEYLSGGDQLAADGASLASGIYKRFNEFDQVTGKVEVVTTGLWTGDTGSLSEHHTGSQAQSSSGDYFYNIFNTASNGEVQYAIAYGHISGSGSVALSTNDNAKFPTKATYMQYRSLLLGQEDSHFTFASSSGAGFNTEDFFVINVARARYKEQLDAGNWSLKLSGSIGDITLIDDSGKKFSDTVGKAGRVFDVVSGSLNLGSSAEATIDKKYSSGSANKLGLGQGYGIFYPDQGIIILNPGALEAEIGFSASTGSATLDYSTTSSLFTGVDADKKAHHWLYAAIKNGADFEARRTENVSTSHYFVRAQNREFNFSNNPTFVSGSDNAFAVASFKRDPRVYITTIGLYNNASEMLAVAKTSQPIAKSFDKEILVKVKLDF